MSSEVRLSGAITWIDDEMVIFVETTSGLSYTRQRNNLVSSFDNVETQTFSAKARSWVPTICVYNKVVWSRESARAIFESRLLVLRIQWQKQQNHAEVLLEMRAFHV